nr:MAG TPA: hypothetical protein [Caudoviricetes sp.]DAH22954.1 MAG TPA: hypothetical protein [Bacteriophage sp.]DAM04414.1 MAG TPA: hypothetical protein [Caudoviricetes sp.]
MILSAFGVYLPAFQLLSVAVDTPVLFATS